MSLISISQVVVPNWQSSITTVQLRIYCDQSFRDTTGALVEQGGIGTNFYKAATCSVNTTNKTITIPSSGSLSLYSTTDSDRPGARYSAYFWDTTNDCLIEAFDDFVGFQLPPTVTTWEAIRTYNLAGIPIRVDMDTFNKSTILSLIANSASMMTGQLGLAAGGTGADLSASSAGFLKKALVGSTALTTATLVAADVPNLENLNTSGGLTVLKGGTGSTTASGARSNLGAAASGANSDITSLSGLSTPLSVAQGGSGASSLTNHGVLLGSGTGAINPLAVASTGTVLVGNTGADPSFSASPSLTGLTLSGTLTLSALTQGSIPYIGAAGLVSQNNTKLAWDNSATTLTVDNKLKFPAGSGGGNTTIQSAGTSAASLTYILPTADAASNGDVLSLASKSTRQLAWVAPGGGGASGVTMLNTLSSALTLVGANTNTNPAVTDNGLDTITITNPQDIRTSGSPTFAGLTLTGLSGVLQASAGVISGSATTDNLTEGSTNKYFANSLARAAVSVVAGSDLSYNSSNGQFTLAVPITATKGGTAQTSYATGDTLYASAANTLSRLPGNITTTKQFLSQTGSGSASAAPGWAALTAGDVPNLEGLNTSGGLTVVKGGTGATTAAGARSSLGVAASGANSDITSLSALSTPLSLAQGGTAGTSAQTAANSILAGISGSTSGDIYYNNAGVITRLAIGSANDVLTVSSGTPRLPQWSAGGGSGSVTINEADDIDVVSPSAGVFTIGRTAIDPTGANNKPFFAAYPMHPNGTVVAGGVGAHSATQLSYYMFYLPARLTFDKMFTSQGASTGGSGTAYLAIYDLNGNRQCVSTATTPGAVSTLTTFTLTAATSLSPGLYLLAWNYTVNVAQLGFTYAPPLGNLISARGTAGALTASNATAGVPNATITLASGTLATSLHCPIVKLGS